jgi:copper homeostasis protein
MPAAKPQRPVLVEVVVDSVEGAVRAARAGAERLELCCALGEGGLTPTPGLARGVTAAVAVPVVAMLRPRRGDFLYDEHEFAAMQHDLLALADCGVAGFAVGVLRPDASLDEDRMAALVAAAGSRHVALHRAFDVAHDPEATLSACIALGVRRILTSGQRRTAPEGAELLRRLVDLAAGRIAVMAGAGVRAANVAALVESTGVDEVHLSASAFEQSRMQRHNPHVAMGTLPAVPDDVVRVTDEREIRDLLAALGR